MTRRPQSPTPKGSGGYACSCRERRKPLADRQWTLLAFTIDYRKGGTTQRGTVWCLRCRAEWETRAKYVLQMAIQTAQRS